MKNNLLPPRYFLICLALIIGAHFIFPVIKIVHPPYNLLGWILIFFGIVLNLGADKVFKKERTTVKPNEKPSKLIISGPFRISRHPMYLGMTAILLGASIFLGSAATFIFPFIFMVFMQNLFIPIEERNLEVVFGKKYVDYKNKVRRWI